MLRHGPHKRCNASSPRSTSTPPSCLTPLWYVYAHARSHNLLKCTPQSHVHRNPANTRCERVWRTMYQYGYGHRTDGMGFSLASHFALYTRCTYSACTYANDDKPNKGILPAGTDGPLIKESGYCNTPLVPAGLMENCEARNLTFEEVRVRAWNGAHCELVAAAHARIMSNVTRGAPHVFETCACVQIWHFGMCRRAHTCARRLHTPRWNQTQISPLRS